MPIAKNPLIVRCFKCQKSVEVKFVPPRKAYSRKNNWYYWTEKEENQDKYICNKCLRDLYKKHKRDFWTQISSLNKRQKLRNYLVDGNI